MNLGVPSTRFSLSPLLYYITRPFANLGGGQNDRGLG